jgi:hypothetical protein
VVQCKLSSRYACGRTVENKMNPSQDSQRRDRDSKLACPKYVRRVTFWVSLLVYFILDILGGITLEFNLIAGTTQTPAVTSL